MDIEIVLQDALSKSCEKFFELMKEQNEEIKKHCTKLTDSCKDKSEQFHKDLKEYGLESQIKF